MGERKSIASRKEILAEVQVKTMRQQRKRESKSQRLTASKCGGHSMIEDEFEGRNQESS
jgi:hypothetical protein